jgi:hypothetical protein
MQQSVFENKANSFGDFYCYYQRPGTNITRFMVATADLDNSYIQGHIRGKINLKEGEVALWNWTSNSLTKLPYTAIKKLTPLGAVLKNHG